MKSAAAKVTGDSAATTLVSSDSFRRRAVEEVSLEEFARGRPIAVRSDSNPRFDREDVVLRARSRLGEKSISHHP